MPLLFINNQYYEQFIHFLNFYSKYQNYKKYNEIFIKYFLIQYNRDKIQIQEEYQFKYLHNHKYNIFAEIVENINYYEMEEVYKIINKIKYENNNYKKLINNWIIAIFDVMADYILFVLKKTAAYYICPKCKNPLLFINENKEIINPNKKEKKYKEEEEDPFLYKALKYSNYLMDIIKENNNENLYYNYIKLSKKKNYQKSYFIANPPKKPTGFINLIYFNDNCNKDKMKNYIETEIDDFKNYTNGLFIFSDNLESFRNIIQIIKNDNENNCEFCLISNGRSFRNLMNSIREINNNNNNNNFQFREACIFCMNKNQYLEEYQDFELQLRGRIYTSKEEVIQFIKDNSLEDTRIYKSLKIITYDNYMNKYYKMHQMISNYYRPSADKSCFTEFYSLIKEEIIKIINDTYNGNQNIKNEIIDIFDKFKETTDKENAEQLLKEYTGDYLYILFINKWLLNIGNWDVKKKNFLVFQNNTFVYLKEKNDLIYEKNAYFVGQLMYRLNFKIKEDRIKNNIGNSESNLTLYRGMSIDYLEALAYPIELGKIISFATFTSTSRNQGIANRFANRNKGPNHFSILMNITVKQDGNLFPLFSDIQRISRYPCEEECLFHPFTFFKLNGYQIDYTNKELTLELEAIGKRKILELGLNEKNKLEK